MRNVQCKNCRAKMREDEFNQHECPATVEPLADESWEDYQTRASAAATLWQQKNLLGGV